LTSPDPSGIRFGSSEIYNIVETAPFTDYVSNSLCVGRRRPTDFDEQVFLFVVMKSGFSLEDIRAPIKTAIREALSPRHVPKFIFAVPDIPMTINGKRVETTIKKIISGEDVKPSSTIQNPQSLAWFRRYRHTEAQARIVRL
jgi:acetoacetyl-CoA synthetase